MKLKEERKKLRNGLIHSLLNETELIVENSEL